MFPGINISGLFLICSISLVILNSNIPFTKDSSPSTISGGIKFLSGVRVRGFDFFVKDSLNIYSASTPF